MFFKTKLIILPAIAAGITLMGQGCSSAGKASASAGDTAADHVEAVPADEDTPTGGDLPSPSVFKINRDSMKQNLNIPVNAMPKAFLYKTSGDYNNNVPVQVNADGSLLSFPAPSDIPANPQPIVLNQGWLLSPVGVTKNTVFTKWTYEEYRNLPQVPTPQEILQAIIPGAKVTFGISAPMTTQEALADTAAVNRYLGPTPRI